MLFGVVFGALVIPPVLDLLNAAYGFAGVPGAGPNALAAPQAALISTLAQGRARRQHELDDDRLGRLLGIGLILLDVGLGRLRLLRLPPLAVGIAIYLPMSATLMVVIGSIIGWFYDRRADRAAAIPKPISAWACSPRPA